MIICIDWWLSFPYNTPQQTLSNNNLQGQVYEKETGSSFIGSHS